ncbi:MAG: hypothetical protein QME48_05495 [bacterium]|uniref:Lipoprotein n=2 Tax=Bacteria candidate phyla TaxID=1783234 RepID=A0A101I2X9_UNCT6|nr:MAG: hypothetical protein XD76_0612 [candidate division TA06 bacterium 32_111]KUK87798.1 MAG: hypothetical protein XE03_0317 [candidate division TA06 bacterium 34_109]MDI6700669.1 hypothetical protein [bacterium]HAF07952.1 hypothetical protein [candidate division WOR-3 bacterium]HCP16346.1 hypothetical protein [candidate division WOR-3 bacterium]
MYKILLSILVILFLSCSMDYSLEKATITSIGFDFSNRGSNVDPTFNDILAIVDYNPSYSTVTREGYIYFLINEKTKKQDIIDLGEAPFNSIDRVSYSMFKDTISPPILAGHLYIIKCKDGYAKVYIHSFRGENLLKLQVNVIYEFSYDSIF